MEMTMKEIATAKLFKNGNSQAIRLPKQFRFEGDEVLIHREGKKLVVEPKKQKKSKWTSFFANDTIVPDDFLAERRNTPPQKRDLF